MPSPKRSLVAFVVLIALAAFSSEVWHNFVYFGARAKAAEAKRNLERLCRRQLELGAPATRFRELGVELERGNRYAYFISPGGHLEVKPRDGAPAAPDADATGLQVDVVRLPRSVSEAELPAATADGLRLGKNGDAVLFLAAGDIDGDPGLDVWSICTRARGEAQPCTPIQEVDDLPRSPLQRLRQ